VEGDRWEEDSIIRVRCGGFRRPWKIYLTEGHWWSRVSSYDYRI